MFLVVSMSSILSGWMPGFTREVCEPPPSSWREVEALDGLQLGDGFLAGGEEAEEAAPDEEAPLADVVGVEGGGAVDVGLSELEDVHDFDPIRLDARFHGQSASTALVR